MKDEYIIINKTKLQKRIEETIKYANEAYKEDVNDEATQHSCNSTISTIESIISQSTPLIPEIEKAFDAGMQFVGEDKGSPNEYISNLKLDI